MRHSRRLIPAALAALFLAASARPQALPAGSQVLTFRSEIDGPDQQYALYPPKDFDPSRKYPLVVSLHGADSNHRINLRRVFGIDPRSAEIGAGETRHPAGLREVDFFVASPLARGTIGYQGIAETDVYDMLADVKRRFPIDEDRVYLTGLSMGGGGTLWLGLTRPDLWAALAAVCPAAPPGSDELAGNALDLPVHLFQGDADPVVPVAATRDWQKRFLALGVRVLYTEYPNVRHNAWTNAYKGGAIFDWFHPLRRNAHPQTVRFATRHYKYRAAYWVELDELTPDQLATIEATFSSPNHVEVKTNGVDGFTLRLAGHPMFSAARPIAVTVDGARVKVKTAPQLSFSRGEKGWRPGRREPAAGEKRPGLEGPIAEAWSGRHIYVYGTAGSPAPEELAERRATAQTAAEWSTPRSRVLYSPRVAADKDVSAGEAAAANLILFGTKETNLLIAKFAPSLPLALNAGAADYGLVYIAPEGNRYLVINSGLPYWKGDDEIKLPGWPFVPRPYRLLLSFPDYVLFKGSLANVIAEGSFDRNWRLSRDAAARMKSSGAVEIRGLSLAKN